MLPNSAPSPSARLLFAALCITVLTFSSAAPSARLAEPLDPLWLATFRLGIAGVAWACLAPLPFVRTAKTLLYTRHLALRVGFTMLIFAVHIAAWMASLSLTSVLRCAVLTAMAPLFAGFFSMRVGERPHRNFFVGCALALLGVLAMAYFGDKGKPASEGMAMAWVGDLLALISALTVAMYLHSGRSIRALVDLRGYLGWVNLGAAFLLLIYGIIDASHPAPVHLSGRQIAALAILGLVPGVVGHGLLNWTVRYVPVHIASLATLLEPVGASILAYFLLGEAIAPVEALGAVALLVGVGIGSRQG